MCEKLALICEGPHDRSVVEALVERILKEEIEWYSGSENHLREWCGKSIGRELHWKGIRERFRSHGFKRRSLGSLHAHGDGLAAEKAIHIIAFDCSPKAHILLQRDCDGQPERLEAMEQARKRYPDRTIIIGFAVDRIEAWILAAFEPKDESEESALENEKRTVGFDPTVKPHELVAKAKSAKKDPKRVLDSLLFWRGNNRGVYAELMKAVQWDHLEKDRRGEYCGILSFRKEIRERLAPRFKNAE